MRVEISMSGKVGKTVCNLFRKEYETLVLKNEGENEVTVIFGNLVYSRNIKNKKEFFRKVICALTKEKATYGFSSYKKFTHNIIDSSVYRSGVEIIKEPYMEKIDHMPEGEYTIVVGVEENKVIKVYCVNQTRIATVKIVGKDLSGLGKFIQELSAWHELRIPESSTQTLSWTGGSDPSFC